MSAHFVVAGQSGGSSRLDALWGAGNPGLMLSPVVDPAGTWLALEIADRHELADQSAGLALPVGFNLDVIVREPGQIAAGSVVVAVAPKLLERQDRIGAELAAQLAGFPVP
jgi:hypothetical protein